MPKPTTFHAIACADLGAGGRFAGQTKTTIVGAMPQANYPAASHQQTDVVPPEAPIGIDVSAVEHCGQPFEIEASIQRLTQRREA
jgi:hypothetical protein